MPEYPERECIECHEPFHPAVAGQDTCTSCLTKPDSTLPRREPAVPELKTCAKPGCEKKFPKQGNRRFCDEHFVGHQGNERNAVPKRAKKGPSKRKRDRRHPAPKPRSPKAPPDGILYSITGIDPKASSRLSITSDEPIDLECGENHMTFRSPGIKLIVG